MPLVFFLRLLGNIWKTGMQFMWNWNSSAGLQLRRSRFGLEPVWNLAVKVAGDLRIALQLAELSV